MIKLKNFDLPEVVQSPMANCTDLPFRLIARRHGMPFAFLEMLSAETLVRSNPNTFARMKSTPEDRPCGAQLVGCDPGVMGRAAAMLEQLGFPLVDINLGCPVPKVVAKGGGSELLRQPETARAIFTAVVRAVRKIPVTVKMRLGYSDTSGEEAIRIARIAQECGVDALCVHGRTRLQGYSGAADLAAIRRVKEAVSIPVLGNGDVMDGPSAVRMREATACDGVMLGRGALGNPWVYREIEAALEGGSAPALPSAEEKKRVLLEHIRLQCEYDEFPVGPLRRIACWYFRQIPQAPQYRDAVNRAQTVDQMKAVVEAAFSSS